MDSKQLPFEFADSEAEAIIDVIFEAESADRLDAMGKAIKVEVDRGYDWTKRKGELQKVRKAFAQQRKTLKNSSKAQ